ncbi:hypothetical protein [Bacillus sp. 1P06AnD]|uniref:hypothetical protein n=1 Tax=Bacillus sp. 1P06AnD TaxID=3132208 RepID=UPI0039A344AD
MKEPYTRKNEVFLMNESKVLQDILSLPRIHMGEIDEQAAKRAQEAGVMNYVDVLILSEKKNDNQDS